MATPSISGTLSAAGDTCVLPISGSQWASAKIAFSTAVAGSVTLTVSVDGGTNYVTAPYAKRIDAATANPTVLAFVTISPAGYSKATWELPLSATVTHVRVSNVTAATNTLTLSAGQPYVPGVPVVGVVADIVNSDGTTPVDTGVMDLSGWSSLVYTFSSGSSGSTTYAYVIDSAGNQIPLNSNNIPNTTTGAVGRGVKAIANVSFAVPLPRRMQFYSDENSGSADRWRLVVRR